MRRLVMSVVVLGLGLVLTGCVSPGPGAEEAPSLSETETTPLATGPDPVGGEGTPSSSAVPVSVPAPTSGEWIDPHTGQTYVPPPPSDEKSRAEVIAAAEKVITAFARPDLDFDTWFAEFEPLLHQDIAMDFAHVDPANVPARRLTGPAVITTDFDANLAMVDVPTNAGTYRLRP